MPRQALVLAAALAVIGCKRSDDAPPPPTAAAKPASDADRAFWTWFASNTTALGAEKDPVAVVEHIQKELDKVDPEVYVELGGDGSDHLLVLSADGHKDRFPAVQRLFAARPTVAGWKIVAFRQRDTTAMKLDMNGRSLDPAAVRYTAARNADKLDVDVFVPGYTDDDKDLGNLAFLALDHTLGEYDVEMKLAGITLHALDQAPASAHALADLPAEVDALK